MARKVNPKNKKLIISDMTIIACDPGQNYGVAIFQEGELRYASAFEGVDLGGVKVIDALGLAEEISPYIPDDPQQIIAVVEYPFFPIGVSRKSAFTFGCEVGTLVYGLSLVCFHISFIRPYEWKRYYGLGKNKSNSLLVVSKLFGERTVFNIKRDHNAAEAILIGWYYQKLAAGNRET